MDDTESLEQHFPETDGYHDFVENHEAALIALASAKSDADAVRLMMSHVELLQESAHTGRWFALRNCEQLTSGRVETLRLEARQFFLLDAACDAANAHFMRSRGPNASAESQEELLAAVRPSIHACARQLRA